MSHKLAKKINTEVLVVTDSKEELDKLLHLLTPEFGSILNSDKESEGVRLFKKYHPTLLIMGFEEVSRAEKFYMSLYNLDAQIYQAPHKTLLLCKGSESSKAYDLCKAGIMNDYVSDRPLFDPHRLNLSVSQALKNYHTEQNSFWLNQHIEKINSGMHKFNRFIKSHLSGGSQQQTNTIENFDQYTKKLTNDLKLLEENLTSLALNEDVFRDDKQQVSAQFDQFKKESIEAASEPMRATLEKSGDWLGKLNSGFDAHQQEVGPDPEDETITEVLLVDDDDMYREIVITMLKSESMHVHAVADGRSALRHLMILKPDIILLDYLMPGIDGLTVLKDIKSNPDTRKIPVIMLTGDSSREVVGGSIHAGAAKFVIKPSNRETLLSKINEVLGKN